MMPDGTFTMDIWVNPQGNGVLGASVHLDYNPVFLQADSASNGDLAFYTQGTAGDGAIDFVGANLGSYTTTPFKIGSVDSGVVRGFGSATASLVTEGERETLISYAAGDNHTVVPTDCTLVG